MAAKRAENLGFQMLRCRSIAGAASVDGRGDESVRVERGATNREGQQIFGYHFVKFPLTIYA